jgi:hypothetical protein
MELTQDKLKELLDYNPSTGEFIWKVYRNWRSKVGDTAGSVGNHGYVVIGVNGEAYLAHRLAFLYMEGEFPPDEVDHINTVETDNHWRNLCKCTRKENNNNAATLSSMSKSHIGKSHTPEHISRISESARNRWANR